MHYSLAMKTTARSQSKKEARARDTHRKILVAATKLFARHGYHKTTITDICRLIDLTSGAVFHHIPTKEALLDAVLAIEIEQGRVRRERWGPRIIDIDILSYGETRLASARLTLPHPAMGERAFVLLPLQEIAPDYRIDGRAIAGRLAELDTEGIEPMAAFGSLA
jgi:AcrR family transcriptional regulator